MKRHRFLRDALVEYEEAVEYYERAQSGLGETLIREIDRVIALTLRFPDMGSLVANTPPELGVRRRLLRRFDIEIDYLISGEDLIVLAIFHCKRRPGYWHHRLDRFR